MIGLRASDTWFRPPFFPNSFLHYRIRFTLRIIWTQDELIDCQSREVRLMWSQNTTQIQLVLYRMRLLVLNASSAVGSSRRQETQLKGALVMTFSSMNLRPEETATQSPTTSTQMVLLWLKIATIPLAAHCCISGLALCQTQTLIRREIHLAPHFSPYAQSALMIAVILEQHALSILQDGFMQCLVTIVTMLFDVVTLISLSSCSRERAGHEGKGRQ